MATATIHSVYVPSFVKHEPNRDFKKAQSLPPTQETEKVSDLDFESLVCPISLEMFKDPVVDTCGHTFSK